jgi:hypothetical protein
MIYRIILATTILALLLPGLARPAFAKEPDEVSAAIMQALFDASPKPNYLVVPNQEEAGWTIRKIIEEMAELNADQAYSCSDEELIEMLKEATAAQRARGAAP